MTDCQTWLACDVSLDFSGNIKCPKSCHRVSQNSSNTVSPVMTFANFFRQFLFDLR